MKRVIGLIFVYGAASCCGAAAAPSTPSAVHARAHATGKAVASRATSILDLAPADEYFGPLKLSILGIRNTIRDLGARYDVNHEIGHQTFTSAELAERSIRDWEHHFPRDGQVPKAIYLLERLYTKVLTQESRNRARLTARWMFSDYASSPQGKQLKKTLALEHLAPIPVDTPTPTPAVEAPPSPIPDASSASPIPEESSVSPAPSAPVDLPTSSSLPTPSASPSP